MLPIAAKTRGRPASRWVWMILSVIALGLTSCIGQPAVEIVNRCDAQISYAWSETSEDEGQTWQTLEEGQQERLGRIEEDREPLDIHVAVVAEGGLQEWTPTAVDVRALPYVDNSYRLLELEGSWCQ